MRRSPTPGPHQLREAHSTVSAHTQILPELKTSFLVSLKTWLYQCCRQTPPLEASPSPVPRCPGIMRSSEAVPELGLDCPGAPRASGLYMRQ